MFQKTALFVITISLVFFVAGCLSNNNFSLFPAYDEPLQTRLVKKPASRTDNRVLLLDIEGIISEWGESRIFYETEATTTMIRKKLEKALRDERIKAVVLRVNSPGGTVTASDIVYREIKKYKQTAKVPIVAAQMGIAASGGYYISCAADKIMAHPTTICGSIGVIMHSFGFSGLFDMLGIESRVIKAGKWKDVGNPFDEMTEGERAILQQIVDDAYERFLSVVAQGRPNLKPDEIREIANGQIYTASHAMELGLIDKMGDLEDAIEEAKMLANIRDAGVILYTTSNSPEQNIFSQTAEAPSINLDPQHLSLHTIMDASRPRFYYMWLGY